MEIIPGFVEASVKMKKYYRLNSLNGLHNHEMKL